MLSHRWSSLGLLEADVDGLVASGSRTVAAPRRGQDLGLSGGTGRSDPVIRVGRRLVVPRVALDRMLEGAS